MVAEQEGGDWQETVEPSEAVAEATPAVEEAVEPDVDTEALSALEKAYQERYQSELESERKKLEAHFNSVADKNTKRAMDEAAAEIARLQEEHQYTQEEMNHLYAVVAKGLDPQDQRLLAQDIQRRRAAFQQSKQAAMQSDPYLDPALKLKQELMVTWGIDPNTDSRFDMSTPKSFVDTARPLLWGLMEMATQPKKVDLSPEPKVEALSVQEAPKIVGGAKSAAIRKDWGEVQDAYNNGEISTEEYQRKAAEYGKKI